MKSFLKKSFLLLIIFGSNCQTMEQEKEPPPIVTEETPLKEGVDLAIKFGGVTLSSLKKTIDKNSERSDLVIYLGNQLEKDLSTYSVQEASRAIRLYYYFAPKPSFTLIDKFIHERRLEIRALGWRILGLNPSILAKKYIEQTLTEAVVNNRESKYLLPEMAVAAKNNKVQSVYTVIRRGLMTQEKDDYASAMIVLDPVRARTDFMDYLSRATIEDLRQIHQVTVDLYTCLVILNFYTQNDLPVFHPEIGKLILFSISRNRALAELANVVIDRHLGEFGMELAVVLSRLPQWVQIAFIENQKRTPTSNGPLLLSYLKEVTSSKLVAEEIDSVLN